MNMKTNIIYIADDGKQFTTEAECKAYENALAEEKAKEESEFIKKQERLKKLCVDTEYEAIPLNEYSVNEDYWHFKWFKLNNEDDYFFINSIVKPEDVTKPTEYPYYICLVDEDDPIKTAYAQWHDTLNASIEEAKRFFRQFGYDCVITKRGE